MATVLWLTIPEDPAGDELADLADWFAGEDTLRGVRVSRIRRSARPEEMGSALEALHVLAQPEGIAVAVVTAATTWLSTRRRTIRIRIKHGDHEIEIDANGAKDIAMAVEQAIALLEVTKDESAPE